jgi:hypothetical protein
MYGGSNIPLTLAYNPIKSRGGIKGGVRLVSNFFPIHIYTMLNIIIRINTMRNIIIVMMALMTMSCEKSETTGEVEMVSRKFEHEGHHYIFFYKGNYSSASGITLDPDYMFQGDTITYEGNRYIKI